jgi:biotin operon repressor
MVPYVSLIWSNSKLIKIAGYKVKSVKYYGYLLKNQKILFCYPRNY